MENKSVSTIGAVRGLHPLFSKRKYATWDELEEEIRLIESTKEKGDAFEQFSYFYLLYHKDLYNIEEIWCDKVPGREIPILIREKYRLERTDYGVDGLSLLTSGSVEAWQSKFRSDQSSPTATELATFWTEAEYCESKRTIANTSRLPSVSYKKINHEHTLLDRFLELDEFFFETLFAAASALVDEILITKFTPRPHQEDMLRDVVEGLTNNDKGKLIAACGTGKTLVALWVSESAELHASKVLVFAPSISLVAQTVREWVKHKNRDFEYLCICSDKSITSEIEGDEEESDITLDDLDFDVTTTVDDVVHWMSSTSEKVQYIFSTYHSVPVLEEALKRLGTKLDLVIFDEAHRTVGHDNQFFSRSLRDDCIPTKKRLFMTATERLVNPSVKTYAQNAGVEIFSMDDVTKYGPTFHDFNFGKAIEAGVIADYEIVLAVIDGDSELSLIQNNAYVFLDETENEKVILSADLLFKAGFLVKALIGDEIKKVISFHSSRKNALIFNRAITLIAQNKSFGESVPVFTYVLGDQNSAERSIRVSNFKNSERGVLGNVHVLSEGVDIPIVDSVYFVDPKKSLIDIVQGIGRALRKEPSSDKIAKVIVPIIIPDNIENLDEIAWDETLATFHSVIQSMRDQDKSLHDEIDSFNEFAVSGGKRGLSISHTKGKVKLASSGIKLPKGVNLEDFLNRITLRVATANGNATGAKMGFSHLGKGQRKSEFKPIMGVLGDYNPDTFRDSLVMPTLNLMRDNRHKTRAEITINHNNVSHAIRLGVIKKEENELFILTHLGKQILTDSMFFEDVFRNQMMLFSQSDLFTYRIITEILLQLKTLNHFEFLFGPYVMVSGSDVELASAKERIETIRLNYPNLELTNLNNRESLTRQLNELSPFEIAHNDIWGDRTTLKNKFRFLANHLSLFDFVEPRKEGYKEPIKIKSGSEIEIKKMLENSNPSNTDSLYGDWRWSE